MLKAASPVSVLLVSWLFGVVNPTLEKILNILVIAVGVAVASAGTVEFSAIGFFFQMGGLAFEAVRVVMTQVMLNGEGLKMDAMVGLYYYAPVVAALNLLVAFVIEVPHFDMEDFNRVGFPMLFLNAAVAFTLNFTSMVLVSTPPRINLFDTDFRRLAKHQVLSCLYQASSRTSSSSSAPY